MSELQKIASEVFFNRAVMCAGFAYIAGSAGNSTVCVAMSVLAALSILRSFREVMGNA